MTLRADEVRDQKARAAQREGKKQYLAYTAASAATRKMHRRGTLIKNNIYKCRFCQHWHIGKRNKG